MSPGQKVKSNLLKPLSTNLKKSSNTLEQLVSKLLTNCLSVFDHSYGVGAYGIKILIRVSLTDRLTNLLLTHLQEVTRR